MKKDIQLGTIALEKKVTSAILTISIPNTVMQDVRDYYARSSEWLRHQWSGPIVGALSQYVQNGNRSGFALNQPMSYGCISPNRFMKEVKASIRKGEFTEFGIKCSGEFWDALEDLAERNGVKVMEACLIGLGYFALLERRYKRKLEQQQKRKLITSPFVAFERSLKKESRQAKNLARYHKTS